MWWLSGDVVAKRLGHPTAEAVVTGSNTAASSEYTEERQDSQCTSVILSAPSLFAGFEPGISTSGSGSYFNTCP